MKDIICWLVENEARALSVYEQAAAVFSDDSLFSKFLARLIEEEKEHVEIIEKASRLAKGDEEVPSFVFLDHYAKRNTEDNFIRFEKEIREKAISRESVMDFIVNIEYSELNDFFMYALNALKRRHREFVPLAPSVHQHKRQIERFLESQPGTGPHLEKIKSLPKIWEENILVVDNDPGIADLLTAMLEEEGTVDTAENGRHALERLSEKYYAGIITDIHMPVMDGMEFYERAVELYPNIQNRFLFFTTGFDPKQKGFFEQKGVRMLKKPTNLHNIKRALIEILSR